MATSTRCNTAENDSFASLASLMKAKKPYVPIKPPTPRPLLSAASNGTSFTSCKLTTSNILSPTAKPYIASASAWVDEQDRAFTTPIPRVSEYAQKDLDRLEALTRSINEFLIDDEPERRPLSPSPPVSPSPRQPPLLGVQLSPCISPIDPPAPSESTQRPVSAYDRASGPVVRVTKKVWDALNNELTTGSKKKRSLEEQLVSLERDHQALRDVDHDVATQIGKLRYQNEANRDQKAEMNRLLGLKDIQIKEQQLEIENLGRQIVDLEIDIRRREKLIGDAEWLRVAHKESEVAHVRNLEAKAAIVQRLEETVERLTRERDAATQAQVDAENHVTRAQNMADMLSSCNRLTADLRHKVLEEQMRVAELEEKVEILQEKADQGNLDNLKELLREKTSSIDRMRTKLKLTERQLENSGSRLKTALNGGEALRGGAHLVAPNEKSKLPKNVISCSECYAKNIACDNGARCRNCIEGLAKCARWRCSMKQKLGDCLDTPCQLPHDPQGWLITVDSRPQW